MSDFTSSLAAFIQVLDCLGESRIACPSSIVYYGKN